MFIQDTELVTKLKHKRKEIEEQMVAIDLAIEALGGLRGLGLEPAEASTRLVKADSRGRMQPVIRHRRGQRLPSGYFASRLKEFMPNGGEKLAAVDIGKLAKRRGIKIRNISSACQKAVDAGALVAHGVGRGKTFSLK